MLSYPLKVLLIYGLWSRLKDSVPSLSFGFSTSVRGRRRDRQQTPRRVVDGRREDPPTGYTFTYRSRSCRQTCSGVDACRQVLPWTPSKGRRVWAEIGNVALCKDVYASTHSGGGEGRGDSFGGVVPTKENASKSLVVPRDVSLLLYRCVFGE